MFWNKIMRKILGNYHITRPGPIRVRGGVLDSGGGGERTRKMKRKKWKEGASTRKKLQLQIGLLCVSRINWLFAA